MGLGPTPTARFRGWHGAQLHGVVEGELVQTAAIRPSVATIGEHLTVAA